MRKQVFNQNWHFWKEGQESHAVQVTLPHDAMILEQRNKDMENGAGSGYFPGGMYWYRKELYGQPEWEGKSVMLEFEGIYMNSTVFLNGQEVGGWYYGYTNFFVDLTDRIRIGETNELLVRADNSLTPNSRWYSGSGIYRPVQLYVGSKTHIVPQSLRVTTRSLHPAVIAVSCRVEEAAADVTVDYRILDPEGNEVAAGTHAEMEIPDAHLWDADHPYLYTMQARVVKNGEVIDEEQETFGIRQIALSREQGLLINEVPVKLKGGCLHHDNGILGACAYEISEFRRIRTLKAFGFNAIRESHYPASKALLKACDELGMLVLDESFDQWRIPNTRYDYSTHFDLEWKKDLTALVAKDYNHPSVIMYCIGNEITDTGRSYGGDLAGQLCEAVKQLDDTRPVTIASNVYLSVMGSFMEEQEVAQGKAVGSIEVNEVMSQLMEFKKTLTAEKVEELVGPSFEAVDIAGYNYGHSMYEETLALRPDRIFLSTETFPARMASNWKWVQEHERVIGDFLWTAWDYLGEAGVGMPVYGTKEAPFAKPYPCLTAACGNFDLIGNPEAAAYYNAIIWDAYEQPFIAVRPVNHSAEEYNIGNWRLTDAMNSWTFEGCEGRTAEVAVYSRGDSVKLFLNETEVGCEKLKERKAEFQISYQPGTLKAVSFDEEGGILSESTLSTAGEELVLHVHPEEQDVRTAEGLLYVPITLTDEAGTLQMTRDVDVRVTVEGPAVLKALGSGRYDPEILFGEDHCLTFHGAVLAVLELTGESGIITIRAASQEGAKASAQAEIPCNTHREETK